MIIGHGPVAFILLFVGLTYFSELPKSKITTIALVGCFAAILPDIDIVFPLVSVLSLSTLSVEQISTQFWASSEIYHRAATHSIIILWSLLGIAGLSLFLQEYVSKNTIVAILGITVCFTIALLFLPIGLPIKILLVTIVLAVNTAYTYTNEILSKQELVATFSVGFFIHPFGDMFTGTPPEVFYPLTPPITLTRVTFVEPTLHFILVFLVEVGSILGLLYILHRTEYKTRIPQNISNPSTYTIGSGIVSGLLIFVCTSGLTISPTVDTAPLFVLLVISCASVICIPLLIVTKNIRHYCISFLWVLCLSLLLYGTLYGILFF